MLTPEKTALVEEHILKARRYVSGLAVDRPPEDQEDVFAAAELGLCEAADHFDNTRHDNFWDWARPRVYGAAIDAIRKTTDCGRGKYRQQESKVELCKNLEALAPQYIDPFPQQLMSMDSVFALIRKLPLFERLVIWLHYVEDVSFRDIAKQTGKTTNNVWHYHNSALKRLRGEK